MMQSDVSNWDDDMSQRQPAPARQTLQQRQINMRKPAPRLPPSASNVIIKTAEKNINDGYGTSDYVNVKYPAQNRENNESDLEIW